MNQLLRRVSLLVCMLPVSLCAQWEVPAPAYVPPDIRTAGEEAFFKDMAVIETNCVTGEEGRALWLELTRNGALVSVIASPRRMLAWVPAEALAAVRATRVANARGGTGVIAVSYTAEQARMSMSKAVAESPEVQEAEDAIVHYLDRIRRPKTELDRQRQRDREQELQFLQATMPVQNCVTELHTSDQRPDIVPGQNFNGGGDPGIQVATSIVGIVAHASFFLESATGTGSWNWDNAVYEDYKDFYVAAMSYWTSFASRYGKTLTAYWSLYGRSSSYTQVSGEPTTLGEDSFIPTVLDRLLSGTPPVRSGWGQGARWALYYNDVVRATNSMHPNYSVTGWIGYKPSGSESIWPHAVSCTWGNGDHEGIYFALDTQYWQAGHTPFAAPMRNVIAHEMGHLWGAPDEYASEAGCYNWEYRGAHNINCQQNQPALGRPGLTMTGFDGIMGWNYIAGNSVATPVHVGARTAAQMSPIRCFMTQPANIPITIKNCDNDGRTYNSTMCIPMDFDYCQKTWVPLTRSISGTTWYYDHWEVTRKSGSVSNMTWVGNELSNWSFNSTLADPVVTIKAVYTSTPPDFNTANASLEAWLAPGGSGASPGRAIALRWRNKYDMSRVETRIEYERTAGNWVELTAGCQVLSPFNVGIGQWTGAYIIATPSGTGTTPIAANTQYRFRIVGYFNTIRGAVSNSATIISRPSSPTDTSYCYDAFEPNTVAAPRVLTSSGPGMTPYQIEAACPISGISGEFSWYHPKNDYYRITVIGVSTLLGGEKVVLDLKVRPGSDFKPLFRAQRVGTTSHITASHPDATTWRLRLSTDGEYLIKVEPQISYFVSNDFVDRTGGHFGFGEYTLDVVRDVNDPVHYVPLCPSCVKLKLPHPLPGILIALPPQELLTKGIPNAPGATFDMFLHPPAGYQFDAFEGGLGRQTANPWRVVINSSTKPGEYEVNPVLIKIPPAQVELVIVHPNGPYGPLETRIKRTPGTLENATATPPTNYEFVGWYGDTVATTNPLPVVMWKDKKIIAKYRFKPCQPDPMTAWLHRIDVVNARQGSVVLNYGMQPGAGDGLEPGQTDLPPLPPAGTFDIRWINITGSQGSTSDVRAIKASHIYQLRVQTGTGMTPVVMSWSPPAATPTASYTMRISGEAGEIDMRTTTSHSFAVDGIYSVTIEVKEKACPPPTKPPRIVVTPVRVIPDDFPCIRIDLLIRDRATGALLPYYNPYLLGIFQRLQGSSVPLASTQFMQGDSLLTVRICTPGTGTDPRVEIQVIPDPEDPDEQPDTLTVPVDVPLPQGQGKLARFLQQHSGEWEMISLPLDVSSTLTPSLYSTGSMLLRFNTLTGAYETPEAMAFGTGYWLKSVDAATTYVGYEKLLFQWSSLSGIGEPYGYGWNLIGAVSKQIAASGIQVAPTGGLRALFGWSPTAGYVVPTNIDPGKGYWVRVNPSTTLTMQAPGFTGGGVPEYLRRAATLSPSARLDLTTPAGESRSVVLCRDVLTAEDVDLLQIPAPPPGEVTDIRTAEGTLYASPGVTTLHVQAAGDVLLTLVPESDGIRSCTLTNELGDVIGVFDPVNGGSIRVPVYGRTTLRLRMETPVASAAGALLGQNYPNPFKENGETVIPYRIETDASARITVVDVLGRVVRTLVDAASGDGASRYIVWNGRDDHGRMLPAGMYVLRLETGGKTLTRTMSIVR